MGKHRSEWSGVVANRFEIQRRLGTGGFGDVYAAYDRTRDSTVALKFLHQTEPKALQRFKREFRSLCGLTQRNLIQLFELQRLDDHWFFTMELVRGKNFLNHVREPGVVAFPDSLSVVSESIGAVTTEAEISEFPPTLDWPDQPIQHVTNWERLYDSAKQLAAGISALHEAGKLHCDLKPGNVLVSERTSRVVVLDFGMVTELTPERNNRKRAYAGTPQYMSPEQAIGDVPVPESDWYAFGVMLYQAMTGNYPVDATNAIHILLQKQTAEPPSYDEFPTDADPDLVDLCRDLLVVDQTERLCGKEVLQRLGVDNSNVNWRVVTTAQARRNAPFVGRKTELRELEQALSDVRESRLPRVIHVVGPSGIGKTQLVRQFVTDIAPAYNPKIFQGRCYENETLPFKAIDSLVDQITEYLVDDFSGYVPELFDDSAQLLTKLFPVLGQLPVFRNIPEYESVDHSDARRWAFKSFRHFVKRFAAGAPIVFFVDDVQWGDRDSGELLNELLRGDDPPPILIVTTYRSGETSPFLDAFQKDATCEVETFELPELTVHESELLATALTESESAAKLIARESQGSPMFIDALARFRAGDVIDSRYSFEEVLASRMNAMSGDARQLLRVIAIAGRPIDRRNAREAARLREDEMTIVAMLKNERLVRVSPATDTLEIYHDRIREAVRDALVDNERIDVHQRLAKVYELDDRVPDDRVARHLLLAREPHRAATFFAAAARKATQSFAYDRAAEHYSSALQYGSFSERDRLQIGMEYAELLSLMGHGAAAAELFLQSGPLATGTHSTDLRRRAADQLIRSGHVERGIRILYDVMSELGLDVPRTDAGLNLQIARLFLTSPRKSRKKVVDERDLVKIDACFSAAVLMSTIDVKLGAFFQLLHHHIAVKYGDEPRLVRALALQSVHLASEPRTRKESRAAIERARELGSTITIGSYEESFVDFSAGLSLFMAGEFTDAHDLFEKVVKDLEDQGKRPWENDMVKIYDLYCLLVMGRFDDYKSEYPALIENPLRRDDHLSANGGKLWSYIVSLMDDEPELGLRRLEEVHARWPQKRYHLQHFWHLQGYVNTRLYMGCPDQALARIDGAWKAIDKAFILRTQLGRIIAHDLRARTHLACVDSPNSKHLTHAMASIKALKKEKTPYATVNVNFLTALYENGRANRSAAIDSFATTEALATRSGFEFIARLARIGGSVLELGGHTVVDRNLDHFARQGVREPKKFVRTFLPTIEQL